MSRYGLNQLFFFSFQLKRTHFKFMILNLREILQIFCYLDFLKKWWILFPVNCFLLFIKHPSFDNQTQNFILAIFYQTFHFFSWKLFQYLLLTLLHSSSKLLWHLINVIHFLVFFDSWDYSLRIFENFSTSWLDFFY